MKWKDSIIFLGGALGLVVSLVTLLRFLKKQDRSQPEKPIINKMRLAIAEGTRGTQYRGMSEILLAQAIHETGIGNSRIFKEKNNMFGMKVPMQRQTKAINQGTNDTYADFDELADSAEDLLMWFEMHNFPVITNPKVYAQALKDKGYYTDTVENYGTALTRHLKKYGIV